MNVALWPPLTSCCIPDLVPGPTELVADVCRAQPAKTTRRNMTNNNNSAADEAHPGWVNFFAKRSSSPTVFVASAVVDAEVKDEARARGYARPNRIPRGLHCRKSARERVLLTHLRHPTHTCAHPHLAIAVHSALRHALHHLRRPTRSRPSARRLTDCTTRSRRRVSTRVAPRMSTAARSYSR